MNIANEIEDGIHLIGELPLRVVRTVAANNAADSSGLALPVRPLDLESINEFPRRRAIAATALSDMLEMFDEKRDEWEMRHLHHVAPRAGKIARHLIDGTKKDGVKDLGKLVGTLVHRALEMGDAFPTKTADRDALLLAHATMLVRQSGLDPDEPGSAEREAAGALPETVAKTALNILKDVLPNNPFRGLLDAVGESEVDFALPLGEWVITGRFDRLIQQNGAWEIVDWKTDAGQPDAIVEKYADQMKIYALALRESLAETEHSAEIIVHLAMTSGANRES